jgi:putative transposase
MPAPTRRPDLPSVHIVQRGDAGAACFLHATNYWFFLKTLRRARRVHGCAIHAYVLMADHFQLLVTPKSEGAVGRMMSQLGAAYVRHFNASTGRSGALWRGREPVRPIAGNAALLRCQRTLELEPVRAGLVDSPGLYRWSSYRHNALGDRDPLVAPHAHYLRLARNDAGRRQRWQALVAGGDVEGRA